ncbi:Protein kinase-like protein 15 [Sarcoptes scabiei]|uniref:Protein kinase-like protein 15 n=1 Tax=Sarcoptes scabiei TaxID=52283 RepID=A0A132A8H6_SARSC|nr:Protein kinase-like protein 15 [Sarcoptes scabiei]
MGNETSLIKKCTIDQKSRFQTSEWTLFDAHHENQTYSVFVLSEKLSCQNLKRWKNIRHPNVVKFYENGLWKNKQYFLTESIMPIRLILDKLHRYSKLSGLYNIGEALLFLHQICNIIVNNLSIDSIFIAKNDINEIWKIGSLYWFSSLQSDNKEFLENLISSLTFNGTLKYLPPEDRDRRHISPIISVEQIHRRDVWSFAQLITELFYCPETSTTTIDNEQRKTEIDLNVSAKKLIDQITNCKFDHRPKLSSILANPLFNNCLFVQLKLFLSNFSTYSDTIKISFLDNLIENLRELNEKSLIINIFTMIVSSRLIISNQIIYNRIMPYFLIPSSSKSSPSSSSFSCSNDTDSIEIERMLVAGKQQTFKLTNGATIKLCPLIDDKNFTECIMPHIINLYFVHDLRVRMLLLQFLPHYGPLISKNCLRKILLPQILLGIKDSDSELVALTFRAIAILIDIFGAIPVLGGGSNRAKYFSSDTTDRNNVESSVARQQNFDRCDSDIISNSSATRSDGYDDKISSIILERSSPDGDETRTSTSTMNEGGIIKEKFASALNSMNFGNDGLEEEWPEWKDCSSFQAQIYENTNDHTKPMHQQHKAKNSKDLNSKISYSNLQTFDIKEIDFKEVNHTIEIDHIFMDMEPKLDFNVKNIIQKKFKTRNRILESKPSKTEGIEKLPSKSIEETVSNLNDDNSQIQIDHSQFEAKLVLDNLLSEENLENDGYMNDWNDESFDWNDDNLIMENQNSIIEKASS